MQVSGLDEANSVAMGTGLQTFENSLSPPHFRHIDSVWKMLLNSTNISQVRKEINFVRNIGIYLSAKTIDLCKFFNVIQRQRDEI